MPKELKSETPSTPSLKALTIYKIGLNNEKLRQKSGNKLIE